MTASTGTVIYRTSAATSEVIHHSDTHKTTVTLQHRVGARRPRHGHHSTLVYVTVPGVQRNVALNRPERDRLHAAAVRELERLATTGEFPQLQHRPGGLPTLRYSTNRGAFIATGFTLRGPAGGVTEGRPVDLIVAYNA